MRIAGKLASEVLDYITPYVMSGVTTEELDTLCHHYMVDVQKTIPAPLNYAPSGHKPYPKSICTSVNNQICHGVPGPKKLKNGDILNIDITVIYQGYHGDTSRMFYIGEPSIQARRLCEVTYEAMWRGIDEIAPGKHLGDIGHAIQKLAEGVQCSQRILRTRHRCKISRRPASIALRTNRNRAGIETRHDFYRGTDDQRGQSGYSPFTGWLDCYHQRRQFIGTMGTHHFGNRKRLRSTDRIGRRTGQTYVSFRPLTLLHNRHYDTQLPTYRQTNPPC